MKTERVFWLILISTCIRVLPASVLELGNDEVYYYTYALHLQPNYFDHPPGVAYLIKLFSLNLLLKDEIFIRAGALVCAAIGTFFSYKTGKLIRNERTGFFAAILYNTSIYTSVIAGTFISPDSPEIVFWLAALWIMFKMCNDLSNGIIIPLHRWLLFGFIAGCCIMCKVNGIFLWAGLMLFFIIYNRKYLFDTGMYLAIFITLLVTSPIIAWNISNHFINWTWHNALNQQSVNIPAFFRSLGRQVICQNPINVFILFAGLASYIKGRIRLDYKGGMIICAGIPLIIVVSFFSLFRDITPDWSGPGYLTITFLGAIWLDQITAVTGEDIPRLLNCASLITILLVITGTLIVRTYPGTLGKVSPVEYGEGDLTLDMWGWRKFNKLFALFLERQKYHGIPLPDAIVSTDRNPAAHLQYYVAGPLHMHLTGVGRIADLHNFAWLNHYGVRIKRGESALTVIPSDASEKAVKKYYSYFKNVKFLNTFNIERNGTPARFFSVYLLEDYLQTDEAHNSITGNKTDPVYVKR